jgi:hypothetical protein
LSGFFHFDASASRAKGAEESEQLVCFFLEENNVGVLSPRKAGEDNFNPILFLALDICDLVRVYDVRTN